MKPSLKAHDSFSLGFETTSTLSKNILEQIDKISPPDKDGAHFFADIYDDNFSYVWLSPTKPQARSESNDYTLSFRYEITRRKTIRGNVPSQMHLLQLLSSQPGTYKFDCQVGFDLKLTKGRHFLIYLPVKLTESQHAPFNIVQGLHLKKIDVGNIEYDIYMEGHSKNEILLNLIFVLEGKIHDNIAEDIIEMAYPVAKSFILEDNSHAE